MSYHITSYLYKIFQILHISILSRVSWTSLQRIHESINSFHERDRFNLQDLNSNGLLEESELIELNQIIAVLHYGADVDRGLLQKKYRNLFRSLDMLGCYTQCDERTCS